MSPKTYFYIDDVIWLFRDLTRQRPSSIFDHPFLAGLKSAHDKYGLKVQLNCFYRTDYFGYQPDYMDKIHTMARLMFEHNYEYIFIDELV